MLSRKNPCYQEKTHVTKKKPMIFEDNKNTAVKDTEQGSGGQLEILQGHFSREDS